MGKYGNIAEILFTYYQKLKVKYPENALVGVFLYGSQNYNFNTENSDIDAKAIYIPTIEQMVNLQQPISKVITTDTGNIEIKDVRSMWQMWRKQNINFLEILCTDFYLTNADYTDLWDEIRRRLYRIAIYNPLYTLESIKGQIKGTLQYKKITGKKVANVARLILFLKKYVAGEDYKDCITVSDFFKQKWLPIKTADEVINKDDPIVKTLLTDLDEVYNKGYEMWKDFNLKECYTSQCTDIFMTKWMIELVNRRAKKLTF